MNTQQPASEDVESATRYMTIITNGFVTRLGVPTALNLLWSAALAFSLEIMAREDFVAWLRNLADNVEANEPPGTPTLRVVQ